MGKPIGSVEYKGVEREGRMIACVSSWLVLNRVSITSPFLKLLFIMHKNKKKKINFLSPSPSLALL